MQISQDGLEKAYLSPTNLYENNNRLFIAGTNVLNPMDLITDVFIPFNALDQTTRYQDAYDYVKIREGTPEEVLEIQAHSLGASIAERLHQDFPSKHYKLFASPSIKGIEESDRVHYYRHDLDPISGLNIMKNITTTPYLKDPHSYKGYI
jgi:hypothetical protein